MRVSPESCLTNNLTALHRNTAFKYDSICAFICICFYMFSTTIFGFADLNLLERGHFHLSPLSPLSLPHIAGTPWVPTAGSHSSSPDSLLLNPQGLAGSDIKEPLRTMIISRLQASFNLLPPPSSLLSFPALPTYPRHSLPVKKQLVQSP